MGEIVLTLFLSAFVATDAGARGSEPRSSSPAPAAVEQAATPATEASAEPSVGSIAVEEIWIGHQVVSGTRAVPVIGDLETRSDSYVLATVQRKQDEIILRQHACGFAFKKVLGVAVTMRSETVARLPVSTIRFRRVEGERYRSAPFAVVWGKEDIDGDGNPGATVDVDSALCGGQVFTAANTITNAEGTLTADGMEGSVRVHNHEQVIDATSYCLRAGSQDKDEIQRGVFRYLRAPAGTTCASLAGRPWPVRARLQAQDKGGT